MLTVPSSDNRHLAYQGWDADCKSNAHLTENDLLFTFTRLCQSRADRFSIDWYRVVEMVAPCLGPRKLASTEYYVMLCCAVTTIMCKSTVERRRWSLFRPTSWVTPAVSMCGIWCSRAMCEFRDSNVGLYLVKPARICSCLRVSLSTFISESDPKLERECSEGLDSSRSLRASSARQSLYNFGSLGTATM